jgi:hypothetical protein
MKMPQLFKTNPGQQPHGCCHKTKNGSDCKATLKTGKHYCFFHDPDPALQQKRAQARREGAAVRNQKPLLPPNLPLISLQTASDVTAMLGETVNLVRQGQIDLRTANTLGYLSNMMFNGMKLDLRAEREAARASAPRAVAGKKPRYDYVRLEITDIMTGETRIIPDPNGDSASRSSDPPVQQDQTPQNGASPGFVEKAKPALVETAKGGPPNAANMIGHSASNPAPTPPNPASPPPQQEQPVQYVPGLGPRYISRVAMPGTAMWRRQRSNPDF